jgi:hypothetical protein
MVTDPFLQAVMADDTLPIDPEAVELWMKDLENPLRWGVMPLLRLVLSVQLHLTWALKRAIPFQFSAHGLLQTMICWFCKHFVSPEANRLILRHFFTESNILNFLIDNRPTGEGAPPVAHVELYPRMLGDMMQATFVDHDQELFRTIRDMGHFDDVGLPLAPEALVWDHWVPMDVAYSMDHRKWTQVLDFETAHVLFMGLFCALLTRDEYRGAINGFNFDQPIALRVGKIIGDPTLAELAYNKYPHYLLGPWNLTQRFLMHGFFTEYLHARLERIRTAAC